MEWWHGVLIALLSALEVGIVVNSIKSRVDRSDKKRIDKKKKEHNDIHSTLYACELIRRRQFHIRFLFTCQLTRGWLLVLVAVKLVEIVAAVLCHLRAIEFARKLNAWFLDEQMATSNVMSGTVFSLHKHQRLTRNGRARLFGKTNKTVDEKSKTLRT